MALVLAVHDDNSRQRNLDTVSSQILTLRNHIIDDRLISIVMDDLEETDGDIDDIFVAENLWGIGSDMYHKNLFIDNGICTLSCYDTSKEFVRILHVNCSFYKRQ